jgi:hypothetical protein
MVLIRSQLKNASPAKANPYLHNGESSANCKAIMFLFNFQASHSQTYFELSYSQRNINIDHSRLRHLAHKAAPHNRSWMLSLTRAATWRQVAPDWNFWLGYHPLQAWLYFLFRLFWFIGVECHLCMIYILSHAHRTVFGSPFTTLFLILCWCCVVDVLLIHFFFVFIRASCSSRRPFWVQVQLPNWPSCRYCLLHLLLLPREVISWMQHILGTHSSVNLISIPWVALYFLDLLALTYYRDLTPLTVSSSKYTTTQTPPEILLIVIAMLVMTRPSTTVLSRPTRMG